MNTGQQVILSVGLAIIIAMGIFPPWLYVVEGQYERNFLRMEVPVGYHLVFTPPAWPKVSTTFRSLSLDARVALYRSGYPRIDYWRLLVQWAGVVIIAGGTIYLLHSSAQAHKYSLLLVAGILLIICVFSFFVGRVPQATPSKPLDTPSLLIPPNEVEIFDTTLQLHSADPTLSGRIRNRSNKTITEVELNISLLDSLRQIDGTEVTVARRIPPGEVRSFTTTVPDLKEKQGSEWSYRVIEVRGQESRKDQEGRVRTPESNIQFIPLVPLGELAQSKEFKSLTPQTQRLSICRYIAQYGPPIPFPPIPQPTSEECKRLEEERKAHNAEPSGERNAGR